MKWGTKPISRSRRQVLWALTICVAVLAVTLWSLSSRRRLPLLHKEGLTKARATWERTQLKNYEMDIEVSGASHGRHHIVVKKAQVVFMTTDGAEVPQSAWEYWNIEGMFQFLSEELVQAENPMAAFGTADRTQVYLSARFEPRFGYPIEYLRQVFGANKTIQWKVVGFKPID